MSGQQRILMTAQDIDFAIQRIALQILEKNHGGKGVAIVGIHTCGVYIARRIYQLLAERGEANLAFGTLDINLYRDDWSLTSQNPVVKTTDIRFDVDGINLILVDDVIFTGRTIRAAMDAIMDYGRPNTVQLGVLVDRGGRELPIQPDFTGMQTVILANERIKVRLDEQGIDGEVVIES